MTFVLRHGLIAALTLLALWAVVVVTMSGETLLAVLLLAVTALAAWTYTSPRTQALRYLFPGVATALVFVIFPMLYTIGLGFTNYSASNLLEPERAREVLLEEATLTPGSARAFTLHAAGAGRVQVCVDRPLRCTEPLALGSAPVSTPTAATLAPGQATNAALPLRDVAERIDALRALTLRDADGGELRLTGLREFAHLQPLYTAGSDGALVDRLTGTAYRADNATGFFTSAEGDRLAPGFRVNVGLAHYTQVFSEGRFRQPFLGVLLWTVVFSALSVLFAAALGMLLAVLLGWEGLRGRALYRLVLFLPYAVPGFISILIFKGLFNQNLGEINFILGGLFGIKPAWFSDPTLARTMLLIVNVWLGFPYMMVLCSGLVQSIPADLYEASAVAGAGPLTNFFRITLPLVVRPLTPLLISAFAFNFNNFVLVSLLTGGRPDQLDATTPVGTTDLLVTYTWRIAFQDSGQQFGLAAAISTVIFLLVAAVTLVQMRFTKLNEAK